jgi:predicted nucleic acid-binding protein
VSVLLDTNVVSEIARDRPDARVDAWLDAQPEDALFISVVTIGELREGIELLAHGRRRTRLDGWLELITTQYADRTLPIDRDVAVAWAKLRAAGARKGRLRPIVDAFIAATALHHGLVLATRNTKDFADTGLKLVNPWEFET